MCEKCEHAVRCVMCSRFRALRNSHQCALLASYHLHRHDMLVRCGTVPHKQDAARDFILTGCITPEEVWAIEDGIRGI